MPRYKLTVEYNGSRFSGFQRQTPNPSLNYADCPPAKQQRVEDDGRPNNRQQQRSARRGGKAGKNQTSLTVQECLEKALLSWTGSETVQELHLRAAGRTDKGVHALGQIVAIQVPAELEKLEWELCRATNSRLPKDIAVVGFELCEKSDFCPRKDAKMKQYSYTLRYRRRVIDNDGNVLPLSNSGINTLRSAHDSPYLWNCPWALDDTNLEDLCQTLQGTHDFSCFVHKDERRKRDNNMELKTFHVEYIHVSSEDAPAVTVKFVLEAKGFRRTQVRNLVGFVVDVCRGHLEREQLRDVLTGTDEAAKLVNAAPASGLCLVKVEY